jgi:hypothetical protein
MGTTRTQRARTSRRRVLASAQEEEAQNDETPVEVSEPSASEVTETSEAGAQ